jgi:hypothetical protein
MKLTHKAWLLCVLLAVAPAITGCISFNWQNIQGPVDPKIARQFSDEMVKDILAENNERIYSNMEQAFRDSYSVDILDATFAQIRSHFGQPLETRYKMDERGIANYDDGRKKAMITYWYDVKTSTAEMGKYFLYVSIVGDGDKTACLKFAYVEFPEGIPENLR